MKHLMKVSLMALVAMFAFNTTADAQLGGLLKKAKAAVRGKSDADKAKDVQKQLQAEKAEKDKANLNSYQAKMKALSEKLWDLYSWKEGKVVQGHNHFYGDTEPISKTKLYSWEENFRDKEMKKKIVEAFLDYEKFENRKRSEKYFYKDRKVVSVLFHNVDWKILRNGLDIITGRQMFIYVVAELSDGFTMVDEYKVYTPYTGAGAYSENFEFEMVGFKAAWMLTDWEHKADADPLKDL